MEEDLPQKTSTSPPSSPLEIPEIVSKIFCYLKASRYHGELKQARQVSRLWKGVADAHFANRGRTCLNWSLGYVRMVHPPQRLLAHVRIELGGFEISPLSQHFIQMFQEGGDNVSSLILQNWRFQDGRSYYHSGQLDFINNILLLTPNLVTLQVDLSLEFRSSDNAKMWLIDPDLKLASLKRLELVQLDAFLQKEADEDTLLLWTKRLFSLAFNISILKFVGSWHSRANVTSICERLLCGERNEYLPNLSCIEIERGEKKLLQILRNIINIPLKRINFGCLGDWHSYRGVEERYEDLEEMPVVEEILERHCDILQVLKIGVEFCKHESAFAMPRLPVLKTLRVHVEEGCHSWEVETFDVLHLRKIFKSQAHLKKTLPQLENLSLTFKGCYDPTLETTYASIFPKNGQCFPQIKTLHLTYPKNPDMHWKLARRLAKIFPSVDNAHFTWASLHQL